MATSTLYQTSPLGSPGNSPRSCLYGSTASPHPSVQPRADWRASFTESCRVPPKPKPLILRQHNGEWKTNLSNISHSATNANSKLQPEDSDSPQAALEPVNQPSTSRLTIGRKQISLRCHVCQASIREPYFKYHLFFGTVKCDLCGLCCKDCRLFERVTISVDRNHSSCQHSFSYVEDPYDYLLPRLSGSDDIDGGGSLTLPNKLRVLEHYINKLRSVQLRNPWCTAVRNCKIRLLKSHTPTFVEPNLNTHNDFLSSLESDWRDDDSEKTPERLHSCISRQLDLESDKETDNGLLLTQDYDLEHLEKAIEYVGVEQLRVSEKQDQLHMQSKSKKRPKKNPYKNLKGQRFTNSHKRRHSAMSPPLEEDEDEKLELVVEDIALPENGNYLMVKEALEECPMCYESLSVEDCVVNMRTYLFTVTCSECGLLIFIVPDLPDGLKIVMENSAEETHHQSEQVKAAKPRRIQPRDFFAK